MGEDNQTTIPLGLLAKMIHALPLDQLSNLPLNKLPRDLPETWFQRLPDDKAAALRARLGELAASEGVQKANSELVGALRRARRAQNIDWLGRFEHAIQRLEGFIKDWRRKARPNAYSMLDEPAGVETTSLPVEQVHQRLLEEVRRIDAEFNGKKLELQDLLRAQPKLKELRSSDTTTQQVAAAIEEAHSTLSKLEFLSARYHIFKLTIACHELEDLEAGLDGSQRQARELRDKLADVRGERKRTQRWFYRVLGRVDEFERLRLMEDETRLQEMLRDAHLMLGDATVRRWLDSIVEIQLDSTAGRMALRRIEETVRRLADMLWLFTEKSPAAAKLPIFAFCDDPFVYVDRYFRAKLTRLEPDARDARQRLEQMRGEILAQLRTRQAAVVASAKR